jgi:glycosyltransferase involved in cell wall biosynthesis
MTSARLLVLPSVREGFGITVVEAQACGTVPVVVRSPMSAATALVRDGVDGRLCESSAESIAAAVDELLSDEARREALAAAALTAAEAWSWDRLASEMESVYLRAASPAPEAVTAR